MRKAAYLAAALLATAAAPAMVSALAASAASMLLESTPFILAGSALLCLPFRWSARMVPFLGCGCGTGPSARSLPAAAATMLVFGPLVACARLAAGICAQRVAFRKRTCAHESAAPLAQLFALAPPAAIAGAVSLVLPNVLRLHASAVPSFALGALAGFALAPCGLGAVGIAAALRSTVPAASAGFLCIAGIADARVWMPPRKHAGDHDAFAYALAALACAIVAVRAGDDLIHPKIALALFPAAVAFAALAVRFRRSQTPALRIAPAVMFAGAILSAPPPVYHATQTSLTDAFPGERVDFTGTVTRTDGATALVRFAITCCRADAAPVVVRLANAPPSLRGWVQASGTLEDAPDGLRLHATHIRSIAPPADPFVYR